MPCHKLMCVVKAMVTLIGFTLDIESLPRNTSGIIESPASQSAPFQVKLLKVIFQQVNRWSMYRWFHTVLQH
jgi:hypothetical protein